MEQIRPQIKEQLIKREYSKALEVLEINCSNNDLKSKIFEIKQKFETVEIDFNNNKIDNETYYYSINKLVMDTLEITDKIESEPSEDWEFVDQLSTSLKLNLIKKQIDYISNFEYKQVQQKSSIFQTQGEEDNRKESIKAKLEMLAGLLHKYEEFEKNTNDVNEKEKYKKIIEALNFQIFQYSKELKDME